MQAPKGTSSPEFPISWLFFSRAPRWFRGGTKGLVRSTLSPLLLCQHHPGREDGRVCSGGGCNLGPRRPQHTGGGEPRLPSRLTAQLVSGNSCQPVVSAWSACAQRRAAPGPSAPNSSGRRSSCRLPTENSPSLVP